MATITNREIQATAETDYARCRSCFVATILVALTVTSNATALTFDDPTVTNSDWFGNSVAIDSNRVLIGAPLDDTLSENIGQAHLFDAVTGKLLQTFNDPTPTTGDEFGGSVAIDGNRVLIGAMRDDTLGGDNGQAHLFDAVTGNLLWTFYDPTPTFDDWFGGSVAIDGNNVLISAMRDETLGSNIGQAHLFDAVTGNLLWTFDNPTPTTRGWFGISVAIDGNNVLVGHNGGPHLFDAVTGNLLQTFNNPRPEDPEGFNWFGQSVALNGNNVLIGSPRDGTLGEGVGQAYLFDAVTGNLLQTFDDPTPTADEEWGGDEFGESVAIDGNNVLIGAFRDDTKGTRVGQAHLFDAVTGNLLHTINDPTVTGYDRFGGSVALDGNNVLIGANGDDTNGLGVGQAHLFSIADLPDPEPDPTADFNSDTRVDGDDLAIWESFFGTPNPFGSPVHEFGDADEDTDIDGQDFMIWQREYGLGVAASASSANIPEPAAWIILLLGMTTIVAGQRDTRVRSPFTQSF